MYRLHFLINRIIHQYLFTTGFGFRIFLCKKRNTLAWWNQLLPIIDSLIAFDSCSRKVDLIHDGADCETITSFLLNRGCDPNAELYFSIRFLAFIPGLSLSSVQYRFPAKAFLFLLLLLLLLLFCFSNPKQLLLLADLFSVFPNYQNFIQICSPAMVIRSWMIWLWAYLCSSRLVI